MFWNTFYDLCISKGTKPNPLCKELSISSATLTKWKTQGVIPTGENLLKIADALSCSVDYLLGRTDVMEVGQIVEQVEALPDDEKVLLDRYRGCDEGGKEIIRAYALTVLRDIEKERITPICGAEGVQEQGQERSSAGGGSTGGV